MKNQELKLCGRDKLIRGDMVQPWQGERETEAGGLTMQMEMNQNLKGIATN